MPFSHIDSLIFSVKLCVVSGLRLLIFIMLTVPLPMHIQPVHVFGSLIDFDVAVKEYAEEHGIDEEEVDITDKFIKSVIGQCRHSHA